MTACKLLAILKVQLIQQVMKIKATDNGIFFFREQKDGTKSQFLKLIEDLNKTETFPTKLDAQAAGNIAVKDFIKKYSKKVSTS